MGCPDPGSHSLPPFRTSPGACPPVEEVRPVRPLSYQLSCDITDWFHKKLKVSPAILDCLVELIKTTQYLQQTRMSHASCPYQLAIFSYMWHYGNASRPNMCSVGLGMHWTVIIRPYCCLVAFLALYDKQS